MKKLGGSQAAHATTKERSSFVQGDGGGDKCRTVRDKAMLRPNVMTDYTSV